MGKVSVPKGDRVSLRPLTQRDSGYIREWINDPHILDIAALPFTSKAAYDLVGMLSSSKSHLGFGIVDTKSKALIGLTCIYEINWRRRTGVTGTIVGHQSYWGRGVALDAKHILLDYAFRTLDLFALISRVGSHNTDAIKHLIACGYNEVARIPNWLRRRNGDRVDEVVFLITQENWLAR